MDAYDFNDEQIAAIDHCNEMLEEMKRVQYEHAGDWEKIDEATWDWDEAHDRCEELGLIWSPDWWEWQVAIHVEDELVW